MPNKEIYTAESPISVKMLNGFVQDGQIEHQNEGEIWLLSKEKIQNLLTTKTDKTYFTKFIFNESVTTLKDGYTYYGSTIDNATVSSGTYYFYNCTGALTVSGNFATVYATNCPELSINGKNDDNWKNIWIDGVATSIFNSAAEGFIIRYLNGTMFQSGAGAIPGTAPHKDLFKLPIAFIDTSYKVIVTPQIDYNDADYRYYRVIFAAQPYSKTHIGIMELSPNDSAQAVPWFTYLAIGRWK